RVSADTSAPYSLVVTRDAAFDTEPNDSFATAQDMSGRTGALGAVTLSNAYSTTAVSFGFEDISGTGSVITGLDGADDASVSIPIGFTFSLFGTNYTSIFVNSNGLLSSISDTSFTNSDLTTTPTEAAIAAYWDDLFVTGASDSHVFFQVLGSGASQHLVIQWNDISYFADTTRLGGLTFEAVLGVDGSIRFNYLSPA